MKAGSERPIDRMVTIVWVEITEMDRVAMKPKRIVEEALKLVADELLKTYKAKS